MLVFYPFNDIIQANKLAEKQLNTIDSCMAWVTNLGQRKRLSYLRARIAGAKYHIALNSEFEKYQWTDLPGQMDSWARSFLYRIDDISSFGNIMSTQNRFVQQNYVEKINKLRKYQKSERVSFPCYC